MAPTATDRFPLPLDHPSIGRIQGRHGKGVIQYLGIQYASLEHRLAEPKIVQYGGQSIINATGYGPPVAAPPGAVDIEMAYIQSTLPKPDVPPMSDHEGLNLNITVPADCGQKLPVLVYIHGGGFTFGSNNYPHYDQSKVVELSAAINQDIIAININYRLIIAGFLTSRELLDAGFEANRGLSDQRVALQWIKKHIAGFGGDASRVTVLGQSAGAASVNFQMHSEEPLFSQAVLLGGSFLMMRPASEEAAEQLYETIMEDLGLSELSTQDRIHALITMPPGRLVSKLTPAFMSLGPVVDGKLIPTTATFAELGNDTLLPLPARHWCKRLLIIESEFDGSIFALVNLNARENTILGDFTSAARAELGTSSVKLLEAYHLSEETPDHKALESAVQFVSDINFYAAGLKLAEAWPGRSYVCHFNEGNPFDGLYKGCATHLLDTAYLWGNYNQVYPERCWVVARAFAEDVVSFTAGTDGLSVFNAPGGLVKVYGPSEAGIPK